MSENAQWVYGAERVYDNQESKFLGVFSSTELAEKAIRDDLNEIDPGTDYTLSWQPMGDSIIYDYSDYSYRVLPLELDVRIRHETI